jgi:hypothetical protein
LPSLRFPKEFYVLFPFTLQRAPLWGAMLTLLSACSATGATGSVTDASALGVVPSSVGQRLSPDFVSVVRPQFRHLSNSAGSRIQPFSLFRGSKAVPYLFVSDEENSDVVIFNSGGDVVGTLTAFSRPQGLATDSAATLYVADTFDNEVQVFAKGYTSATTLSDAGEYPTDVAVSTDGVVAATSFASTSDGPGDVAFYAKGATSPTYSVASSSFQTILFDAFDMNGNLFIDGQDQNFNPEYGVIRAGQHSVTLLRLDNKPSYPGGIVVDKVGHVLIGDQGSQGVYPGVYTYKVAGERLVVIAATQFVGVQDPTGIALLKDDKDIYSADSANNIASEFSYPRGGSVIEQFSGFQQPVGIAVVPVQFR